MGIFIIFYAKVKSFLTTNGTALNATPPTILEIILANTPKP